VAIDARYVRDRPSGIGSYVQGLLEHVPRLAPDLEIVVLKHPTAPTPIVDAPNVREVVVPWDPTGPVTMWLLPAAVDLRGLDLFHAPFNLAPFGIRAPLVSTIHDTMWLANPHLCQRPGPWGHIESRFWSHGMRRALARSERIFTPSQASADAIAEYDPSAKDRTRVTLLGIDPFYRPAQGPADDDHARRARERWVPGADRYVIAVGQFAGYKNHEAIVRAFDLAFRGEPRTHLLLVQRLGRHSRLVPIIRARGLAERVHFAKGVSFEDLRALLWGALGLAQPSFIEGFGLPVGEALASGCPVVTSDRSAMPEVTAGAGLHVDPHDDRAIADALAKLGRDEALRLDLRARGLARARQLTQEANARATLAVYREVLGLPEAARVVTRGPSTVW
jgi:glycosyltransferase involved in cell wall biosynthesis